MVFVYEQSVSRSGYGSECMGWLYRGHDVGVKIWVL
jgi:hypothetical protein